MGLVGRDLPPRGQPPWEVQAGLSSLCRVGGARASWPRRTRVPAHPGGRCRGGDSQPCPVLLAGRPGLWEEALVAVTAVQWWLQLPLWLQVSSRLRSKGACPPPASPVTDLPRATPAVLLSVPLVVVEALISNLRTASGPTWVSFHTWTLPWLKVCPNSS